MSETALVIHKNEVRPAKAQQRVYISVNGEGYGHSSRALAVASHFDPKCVLFGSYGYVLERIKRAGYAAVEVEPEVKFFGEDGSFEISQTILKNSTWPLVINRLMREEVRIMKQYGVNCVLSDCRPAAVFAAAKLGLPCVYMTNQTRFDYFFTRNSRRGRGGHSKSRLDSEAPKALHEAILCAAAEPSVELVARTVFRQVDEVVIADFPPPDTVCLPVLSRKPQIMKLQRMVGPITAWRADEVVPAYRPGYGPYVVGTLGGHQYRLPLFQAMIEAAYRLPEVQFEIFSSFRCQDTPPNVRINDFTDTPERY